MFPPAEEPRLRQARRARHSQEFSLFFCFVLCLALLSLAWLYLSLAARAGLPTPSLPPTSIYPLFWRYLHVSITGYSRCSTPSLPSDGQFYFCARCLPRFAVAAAAAAFAVVAAGATNTTGAPDDFPVVVVVALTRSVMASQPRPLQAGAKRCCAAPGVSGGSRAVH